MNVNNLSGLINKAALESLGAQAITVTDTASLVSLGGVVMSTDTNTDRFWSKLADRIGRVDNKYKLLKRTDRFSNARNELEWGIALQKNQVHHIRGTQENKAWAAQQGSPYNYNDTTNFTSTIFSKIGSFQTEPVVAPRWQLQRTFLNMREMGSFLEMLDADMNNAFTLAINNNERTARNAAIECAFRDGNAVDLAAEYNAVKPSTWQTLDVTNWRYNPDFLRFAYERIKAYVAYMTDETQPSRLFNGTKSDRWTRRDDLRVEVLASFASAARTYLMSDTYNKDLVDLFGYREIRAWQGTGNTVAMTDADDIYVALETTDGAADPDATKRSGVLAFVYDKDRVGTLVKDERVASWYNPDYERQTTKKSGDLGYYVDRSEQGVVFYVGTGT